MADSTRTGDVTRLIFSLTGPELQAFSDALRLRQDENTDGDAVPPSFSRRRAGRGCSTANRWTARGRRPRDHAAVIALGALRLVDSGGGRRRATAITRH